MVRLFNIFRHKNMIPSLVREGEGGYQPETAKQTMPQADNTPLTPLIRGERRAKLLKAGFSLAEVLVAMLIMSVFYVATAKVLTVKQRHETHENPHGYYECIGNSSPFDVHRVDSTIVTIPPGTRETECEFVPISGIPFYNIYIITPDGIYNQTESQLNDNDNMVFRGANDLIQIYSRLHENTNAEVNPQNINDIMQQNDANLSQLRTFIRTDYPQSRLSGIWGGTRPTQNAVFITW